MISSLTFDFLPYSPQVCCKDLWYLEVEPPQQAGRVSLVRASTTSLELAWPATPATNTYILEVQKLPPTASPSPVSTPTPIQQPLQQPTPIAAATASPVTMVNSAGNVYRLQKTATSVQQPVRVIGSPMAGATGAKLGQVLGKSPGGHQVMSVMKGAQFVSPIVAGKAAGTVGSGTVQRATTIGGIKQLTTAGSLIHQQGAGGNIVTVSPQQASNLVGQKIVLQKSTLQQFQQQGTGQKVNVTAAGSGGGPQIVKLVKTAQGTMQVQGAVSGTKVVNPATGKIIQMATGQQFFTINKSSGQVTAATSAGGAAGGTVAGQQVQKRIITTGPGGTEQQIIVVSQSPNTSMQIRPNIVGQTATTGARGPIKIQTMAGGTKQFTIGGKPVTVQLGGVGKRPLTIMTPQHAAGSAGGSIINAQAAGSAGGQTAGGQQILILPSGQGGVLQQAGGRKSYIQIVGGSAGGGTGQQTTVTGQKMMPRIVINQPQQLQQQGQGNTSGGGGSGAAGGASNIEQVDGAMDGEWTRLTGDMNL